MKFEFTNDELRSLIPNVLHEVEGEPLLATKIAPWLETEAQWLDATFCCSSMPDHIVGIAKKVIVGRAFARAVPSLDLTITPAGFSVINTEGRAPASKERVERLVAALDSSADANLVVMLAELLKVEGWANSSAGTYWTATFMNGLEDARDFFQKSGLLMPTFRRLHDIASSFQEELAEKYIGKRVLNLLLRAPYELTPDPELMELRLVARRAELIYLNSHFGQRENVCPNEHEVWHLAQPLLMGIRYCPAVAEIWREDMADLFNDEPATNSARGAYFF